jgi:hypothetical protein
VPERIRFTKEDIGGEVLSILTTGLYRDPLDTLREYIQNAIDAKCEHIELTIDPDTIAVTDDGVGMNADEARRAIRLGISDKNPLQSVGFRGIGIYSAFNLCEELAIHTRAERDPQGYVITINFKLIREELLREQERRKKRLPPALYLEKLLESSVFVDVDQANVVQGNGTKAIMTGLLGDVYQRLNDWDQVEAYLENVVPLPFRPDFKWAKTIERRLRDEAHRIVPVTLQILVRREEIYRPYRDSMFSYGGRHEPKFFAIPNGKERFGIAWVCINDARQVLKNTTIRGLLIKKFGFSIANRSFLEPFFKRPVFNRRITGEVIVEHQGLIPNAARSDFEHNSVRQAFLVGLGKLTQEVSAWGDKIQQEDKAREVLEEVRTRATQINSALASLARNQDELLRLNVEVANLGETLELHGKTLKSIEASGFTHTRELVKECADFIETALVKRGRGQKALEQKIVRSVQREAAEEKEPRPPTAAPTNLADLLEAYALTPSTDLMAVLAYLDESVLQARLSREGYEDALRMLREFLDERM